MLPCMHVQASQQFLKQGKCFPLLHPSHSRVEESPSFFELPTVLLSNRLFFSWRGYVQIDEHTLPVQKQKKTHLATSLRQSGFIYSISSYCFFRYGRRGVYLLKECQKYQLFIYCFHFPKLELKDF